jgi:PAS domain S-box-containing protein
MKFAHFNPSPRGYAWALVVLVAACCAALGIDFLWAVVVLAFSVLTILTIQRDRATRKKTEEALRESEKIVQHLLDSTVEAIYGVDKEGNCNFANPSCLKLLGYHREDELLGRNMHGVIHHTRADGMPCRAADCLIARAWREGAQIHCGDEVFWRSDGGCFPSECWSYPLRQGDQVTGAVVCFLDISERKSVEKRLICHHAVTAVLAESHDLADALARILRAVCEGLSWDLGLVWRVDGEAYGLSCAEVWPTLAAYEARAFEEANRLLVLRKGEDLPGRVWEACAPAWVEDISFEKNPRRRDEASRAGFASAFAAPIFVGSEVWGVLEFFSGEERKLDGELLRLFHAIGIQIGQFIERRRADIELKEARDAAVEASRAKSAFLATMSHEIRTPMNAIMGMADLLSEMSLTLEQQEYVDILKRGGDTLLKLINDILDLAKVESGQIELEEMGFDLREFIERTIEFLAIRAHQKGLELTCHVTPDVPNALVGDTNRLRQILINLIGNAIKFTEKGEVSLEVERDRDERRAEESRVHLIFSVRDTGSGIPQDKLDVIFNPFTQGDSSTTRRFGGTGLGLSICKKLVERMGGRIGVESEMGKGSRFYFSLEMGIGLEAERRLHGLDINLKGVRALVVDDNGTTRFILRETLASWGMLADEAQSGKTCLDAMRRAQEEGTPYEVLLLDCRMPGMGGFEVAERVRHYPELGSTIIMMLNSDARSGDIASSRNLGLSGYLVKPVKRADLLDAVKKVLGQKRLAASGGGMPAPSPLANEGDETSRALREWTGHVLKLLLVEDSVDNRLLIQSYLKKFPFEIDIAENGRAAVDKFRDGRYDLVLMDMHMPVMDGYEATREIRQWEREHNGRRPVPIIALTANALKEEIEKSLEAGCNAHLAKPVKKMDLLKEVSAYTRS